MKLDNQTIICILITIIIGIYLLKDCSNNVKQEGFTTKKSSYTKFEETRLGNTKPSKNNKVWNNVSLEQCQFKCDENKSCVGFVRPNSSDNKRTSCYIKTDKNLGDCHSLRKGNPDQRRDASDYNTFIKTSFLQQNKNLLTNCIGDEKLTLNQFIYIQSILKPNHFISVIDNEIKMGEYVIKGIEFNNTSTFKIIKGLDGSGTVSFILKDNYNENYYIYANQDTNKIELVSINIKESTQKERTYASFELHDGLSDSNYISIKAFTTSDNNKFIVLDGYGDKKTPRLQLKEREELTKQIHLESATFKIANNVSNTSIIKNPLTNISSNTKNNINDSISIDDEIIKNKLKKHNNQELVKKEQFNSLNSALTLIDIDNNKLMIPLNSSLMKINTRLLNSFISKLNNYYKKKENKTTRNEKRAFDINKIMKVNISHPEDFSVRVYDYDFTNNNEIGQSKNIFDKENVINYKNDLGTDNYFLIASIQIFTHNPKNEFIKKINEKKDNYVSDNIDFVTSKLNYLKEKNPNQSIEYSFNLYSKDKEQELNDYKEAVVKTELSILQQQENLRKNLEDLKNQSNNYKLKKHAKNYYIMKNLEKEKNY